MSEEPAWLVPEIHRHLTPNRWHAGHRPELVKPVELVVLHFTASSFDSAIHWHRDPISKVSSHFIVSRSGQVVQLAPLTDRTFHAGAKTALWRTLVNGAINGASIGIELENWGRLERRGTRILTWTKRPYDGDVFLAKDSSEWAAYPSEQIDALAALLARLLEIYPILREGGDRLVGHEAVDPGRKEDPGPAFPWHVLRQMLEIV